MKKTYGIVLMLACISLIFTGCGKTSEEEEQGIERYNGSAVANYRGVVYKPYDTEVTQEDVQAQVDRFIAGQASLEEVSDHEEVQSGDIVNIDYTGYMDGEAFENGQDTDFDLEIGSGSFIPGFEDGLIGAKKGSTLDVKVTFPDPYKNNLDFSGKEAVFSVTVNKICKRVLPELTDELVSEVTDYETVGEYKEYIKNSLKTQKENYAQTYKTSSIMGALIENAEFTGIDQADIDKSYESAYNYYKNLAATYESVYGFSFSTFIYQFFGCTTEKAYEELLKQNAEYEVKKTLILYYVIEQEGLKVTDEEYDKAVTDFARTYNMTEEEFLEQVSAAAVRENVLLEKAENLIYDTAVAQQ